MAVALSTILNWFKTGQKPTQAQFWDTFSSFRHKNDKIPVSDVEGIDTLITPFNAHFNNPEAHAELFAQKADLINGKVPAEQLPSYVDDIIEVNESFDLPEEGETGKIYVTISDNKQYRWSDSGYIQFSGGVKFKCIDLASFQLSSQDVDGMVAYINALETSFYVPDSELVKFVITDTKQIFELKLNGRSFGANQIPITANDILEIEKRTMTVKRELGTSYTLQSSDFSKRIVFTSDEPITLNVPFNWDAEFPIGSKVEVTQQGNGIITIRGALMISKVAEPPFPEPIGVDFVTNLPLYTVKGETRILTKIESNRWTIEGNKPTPNSKTPFTIYVDNVSGNDTTAIIETIDKPFLTLQAALNALPSGTEAEMWTIWMLKPGTHTITAQITAGRNLTFKSLTNSVVTTSLTDGTAIINGSNSSVTWGIVFDMPYGEFKIDTISLLHQTTNCGTFTLDITLNKLSLIGQLPNVNFAYLNSGELKLNVKQLDCNALAAHVYNISSTKGIEINIGVLNSVSGYANVTPLLISDSTILGKNANVKISSIIGNAKVILAKGKNKAKFHIGNVNLTAEFDLTHYSNVANSEFTFVFENSNITATSIYFHNQTTVCTYIEGEILSMSVAPVLDFLAGATGKVTYRNFRADFGTAKFNYYSGLLTFEDCNITCNGTLLNLQSTFTDDNIKFIGHNTVRQTTPAILLNQNAQSAGRIWVEGSLMTNAISVGLNVYNAVKDVINARVTNTIFLNATSGSDTLGEFENPNKPYATLTKALEVRNLVSNDGADDKNIVVKIMDSGSYSLTKEATNSANSTTNIKLNSLRIHADYAPTVVLTKSFTINHVDLVGINLTIDATGFTNSYYSFGISNSTAINNLQIKTLTITGTSVYPGLITYGIYQNYSIEHYIANAYSAIGVFGGNKSFTPAVLQKLTNNATLYHISYESSRIQIAYNENIIIGEVVNAVNAVLNVTQQWNDFKGKVKISKVTNTGGNIVQFLFNSNSAGAQKYELDLNNGVFENFYIGSPYFNQPVKITGRCEVNYTVAPTKSFITVDRNTKTIGSYGESFLLTNFKVKITYPSTPTWKPIRISGVNTATEQKQIVIEDVFIETSHPIEIFDIVNGVSTNTQDLIQFRGVNDFKNGKELIAGTLTPTVHNFITSRAANIRHDYGVISTNLNLQIFNEMSMGQMQAIRKITSSSLVLDNTYNGCLILIKSNCTVSIPSGLLQYFSCQFRTTPGFSASFVAGSGVTLDSSDGLILGESKMCFMYNENIASTYSLDGELNQ